MSISEIPKDHPANEFVNFAQLVWKHLKLPKLTPVQREICNWLQYGPKRSQTWAFRGVGKSYLTSAYACWLLLLNPDEQILVLSASKERADFFVRFCRRLIDEIPVLNHLRPDRAKGSRDSTLSFDVGCIGRPAHVPSVRSAGITGQLAGSRASTIILDDVEIPTNSATPQMRERLSEAVKEVDAILLPEAEHLSVNPKVRILGTPQSMETVYLQLAEKGYDPRVWPVQVPEEHTRLGYRGALAPSIEKMILDGSPPGTPTEPSRFDREDIEERRLSYGTLGFMLQFMLSTALSDAEKYPLKTKDLVIAPFQVDKAREVYVWSNHPQYRLKEAENVGMHGDGFYQPCDTVGEWVPFEKTIIAIDPSARGKDETAVCTLSQLGGQIFLHRVWGSVEGYAQSTLEAIAMEAKRVKANLILIEANYADGMFSSLLRPVLNRIYPCSIEEVKHSISKERRIIDTLAPVTEGHRLIVNEGVINSDKVPHSGDALERARERQLFYQMTHLTDERNCLGFDDRIDCLSIGVAHFAKNMLLDAHMERRRRNEAEWDIMHGEPVNQTSSWFHHGSGGNSTFEDPFAL